MKDAPPERASSKARQLRLARALRENLKRRKEQARARLKHASQQDACNHPSQVPISRNGESSDDGETG
jgi:hypothetical protein